MIKPLALSLERLCIVFLGSSSILHWNEPKYVQPRNMLFPAMSLFPLIPVVSTPATGLYTLFYLKLLI
ncbi:hypothetical protein F5B19DRAFT_477240 [Rostrohypoxylon terebratum]|nr:hypothetical protein F5B19DRAFT_477240 [Rostrohypoxylon terebratum]